MKPPMQNGVSASRLYLEKLTPTPANVFAFLCNKFAHISPQTWRKRFANAQVLDAHGKPLALDTPYVHGTLIYYYRHVDDEIVVPFEYQILFENNELMVVDKPHFLTTAPAGKYARQTLLSRLKDQTGNADLSPIHRLDRETAGLLLISKNPATRHVYQTLFAQNAINKTYHAIAPKPHIDLPLTLSLHLARGEPFYTMQVIPHLLPNSTTHISLLEQNDMWAKYQLNPTTGKLHQLRVHLAHLGLPIKDDAFYPTLNHKADDDFNHPLQLLAKALKFLDPITGQSMSFTSPQELYLPPH